MKKKIAWTSASIILIILISYISSSYYLQGKDQKKWKSSVEYNLARTFYNFEKGSYFVPISAGWNCTDGACQKSNIPDGPGLNVWVAYGILGSLKSSAFSKEAELTHQLNKSLAESLMAIKNSFLSSTSFGGYNEGLIVSISQLLEIYKYLNTEELSNIFSEADKKIISELLIASLAVALDLGEKFNVNNVSVGEAWDIDAEMTSALTSRNLMLLYDHLYVKEKFKDNLENGHKILSSPKLITFKGLEINFENEFAIEQYLSELINKVMLKRKEQILARPGWVSKNTDRMFCWNFLSDATSAYLARNTITVIKLGKNLNEFLAQNMETSLVHGLLSSQDIIPCFEALISLCRIKSDDCSNLSSSFISLIKDRLVVDSPLPGGLFNFRKKSEMNSISLSTSVQALHTYNNLVQFESRQ